MSIVFRAVKSVFTSKKSHSEADLVFGFGAASLCLVFLIATPLASFTLSRSDVGSMEPSLEGFAGIICLLAGFWGRARIKGSTQEIAKFSTLGARGILRMAASLIRFRSYVLILNVILMLAAVLHNPEYTGPDLVDESAMESGSVFPVLYLASLFILLFIDDVALLLTGSGHLPATRRHAFAGVMSATGSYAITVLAVAFMAVLFFLESKELAGMLFYITIPVISIGRHVIISDLISRGAQTEALIDAAHVSATVSFLAFTIALISILIDALPFIFGDTEIARMALVYSIVILAISEGQGHIFRHTQKVAEIRKLSA